MMYLHETLFSTHTLAVKRYNVLRVMVVILIELNTHLSGTKLIILTPKYMYM